MRTAGEVPTEVDVVVVGSGAGGLAAAVTCGRAGLSVVVLEKEPVFGGTTARSGGVLWIPCSAHARRLGIQDSFDEALRYMQHEAGEFFDEARARAFLVHAPRMVEFFERETSVRFEAVPDFADYHPAAPGGREGGRCLLAAPFDGRELGADLHRLRAPLREITFVGMMFNASEEIAHFFNVTRSLRSAAYVARRLLAHSWETVRYRRATRLTNGNALVARLAKSVSDAGAAIHTGTPVRQLIQENDAVVGVRISDGSADQTVRARRGVVLATGGFPHDLEARRRLFPHAPTGREHWSPAAPGNTGDGRRLASAAGARLNDALPNAAAWIPVSRVPRADGEWGVFPHLIDRYKPGFIAVNRRGERFVNEADSYHDFGQAMQRTCMTSEGPVAWLMCDHPALRRYGLGYAKPFPLRVGPHIRSGYLLKGDTLAELASKAGIDATALTETVERYNEGAKEGRDPQFRKGESAYNRYLGDATHRPNPCVAALSKGPYYAVKLVLGDLGTFAGVRTDEYGRALDEQSRPIKGLYTVGNDAASVMGGAYPGGGITLGPAMTFGYLAGRHLAEADAVNALNASAVRTGDAVSVTAK